MTRIKRNLQEEKKTLKTTLIKLLITSLLPLPSKTEDPGVACPPSLGFISPPEQDPFINENRIHATNLFNPVQFDAKDFIVYNLFDYFFLEPTCRNITLFRIIPDYGGSVKIIKDINHGVIGRTDQFDLLINGTELYNYLKKRKCSEKETKDFKFMFDIQITLDPSWTYFEGQTIKGEMIDVDNDVFNIPSELAPLSFVTGGKPILPYNNKNIFISDLDFSLKNIKSWKLDEEKGAYVVDRTWNYTNKRAEDVGGPFAININEPFTINLYGWNNQIHEDPSYWRIHHKKYLVYITESSNILTLKLYKVINFSGLKLMRGLKLAGECNILLETEDFGENSILLLCKSGNALDQTVWYYMIIIDENNDIVTINSDSMQSNYSKCTRVTNSTQGTYNWQACDNNKGGIVFYEIFAEPLQFKKLDSKEITKDSLSTTILSMLNKSENNSTIEDYDIQILQIDASGDNLILNLNFYGREETEKKENLEFKYMGNFLLVFDHNSLRLLKIFRDLENDTPIQGIKSTCLLQDIVIIADSKENNIHAVKGMNTSINLKSTVLQNGTLIDSLCVPEINKYFVLVKEKEQKYKMVIYNGENWLRANTRLFRTVDIIGNSDALIAIIGDGNYLSILSYQESQRDTKKLWASTEKRFLFNAQVFSLDYPKIEIDMTSTNPGNYTAEYIISNSLGYEQGLLIPLEVVVPKKLEVEYSKDGLKDRRKRLSGRRNNNCNSNEINLWDFITLNGTLFSANLDKMSQKEIEYKVKLTPPVSFYKYFLLDDQSQNQIRSFFQCQNHTYFQLTKEGQLYEHSILDSDSENGILRRTLEDDSGNYIYKPVYYKVINSEIQPYSLYYHIIVSKKYLKHVKVYEQDDPQIVLTIYTNSDQFQFFIIKAEFIIPNFIFDSDEIADRSESLSSKIEVMMADENRFVLAVSDSKKSQLLIMKYYREYDEKTQSEIWKSIQLNLINSERVGRENFKFNDYEIIPVNGEPEIHFILDDMIIVLRFCTFIGHIKEVFHKNQMEKYSRLLTLKCFQDRISGKDVNEILEKSRCLISTEAEEIHHYVVNRLAVTPTYEGKRVISSYKIDKIDLLETFFYPMPTPPDHLHLGFRYFTASSLYSKYLMIFDFENPKYAIGSIKKPYDSAVSVEFTKYGDDEFLIVKSEMDTGKIFKIGDFKLGILNDVRNLDGVNIKFNENIDYIDSDREIYYNNEECVNLTFNLDSYKKSKGIFNDEKKKGGFFDNLFVQIFGSLLISCFGIVLAYKCVKKEKVKREKLERKMKRVDDKVKKLKKMSMRSTMGGRKIEDEKMSLVFKFE